MTFAIRHRTLRAGEVRLHCAEAGPEDGPLVLLLHGFPECWVTWKHQLPALAAAGFHVVAPDLRGYGRSDRPEGIAEYRVEKLAADIGALIDALGSPSADVVGHDWGGLVGYHFAMWYPDKLRKLVVLNIPHPQRMARGLLSLRQLRMSWYAFFFLLPFLPERGMAANHFRTLRSTFSKALREPYDRETVDEILAGFSQPGALTAALNYYRALARPFGRRWERIDKPVLVIWGEQDRHLGRELAEPDPRWASDVRVVRIADAAHWVHADARDRVNELLLHFL